MTPPAPPVHFLFVFRHELSTKHAVKNYLEVTKTYQNFLKHSPNTLLLVEKSLVVIRHVLVNLRQFEKKRRTGSSRSIQFPANSFTKQVFPIPAGAVTAQSAEDDSGNKSKDAPAFLEQCVSEIIFFDSSKPF